MKLLEQKGAKGTKKISRHERHARNEKRNLAIVLFCVATVALVA
jgi:hypothetical protein